MKKRFVPGIVFVIFWLALRIGPATGQNVGEVRNLFSNTHSYKPSWVSQIEVSWDMPEGDPYCYYAVFNTEAGYKFDDLNTVGMPCMRATTFMSRDYASSEPDDVRYHCHVAAVDGDGEIGQTKTAGPFRIDVVPPSDAYVITSQTAPTRSVRLAVGADGASEMYVSNYTYEKYGEWEPFFFSRRWELTRGGGEKTVYVRFRDLAGNTADVSATINRILGDIDKDREIGLRDAVSVLQLLAGAVIRNINPDADVNDDGKIGAAELIFIMGKASGQ